MAVRFGFIDMMRALLLGLTVCMAGAQQYMRGERPRMVVQGFNTGEVVERQDGSVPK
jgi:hypothetical protein